MKANLRFTLFGALSLAFFGCGDEGCLVKEFRNYVDSSRDIQAYGLVNDTLQQGTVIDFQLNIQDSNLYVEMGVFELEFLPRFNSGFFQGNKLDVVKGSYSDDHMSAEYNPENDTYEFHALVTLERLGKHEIDPDYSSNEFSRNDLCVEGAAIGYLNLDWFVNVDDLGYISFYVIP